jgi:REP element-mobilizing transposase RayT
LRVELAGGLYHVTARGNERKFVFRDDEDRARFLAVFGQVCDRYHWRCLACCLMGNHYHLVVETLVASLSRGMRQLNGVYSQRFNRRHLRVGHLFQGRYFAGLIEEDGYLPASIRYALRNPVRAGLVASPADWEWSSYRAIVGVVPAPVWLAREQVLALFGGPDPVAAFEAFVCEGDGELVLGSPAAGSRAFIAARVSEHGRRASREVPERERLPVAAIALARAAGDADLYQAYRSGLTMRDLAELLGCHYSTVSRRIARYEKVVACKT